MRVWSGWDRRQDEAAKVFAWSVAETSKLPVEFVSTSHVTGFTREGVTQFSYARFLVPWMCQFEGRAVFGDGADMLCLGDLNELAEWDMDGAAVAVAPHPQNAPGQRARADASLMLMDCAKLKCWTPEYVAQAHDAALMRLQGLPAAEVATLPPEWNVLVQPGSEPPDGAKIAHWSGLSQPEGGPWIHRSGSKVWAAARDSWRAAGY